MPTPRKHRTTRLQAAMKAAKRAATTALALCLIPVATQAQGIPTYDNVNMLNVLLQLEAWANQAAAMDRAYSNQNNTLNQISGVRNLGKISNQITGTLLGPDVGQEVANTQSHEELNELAIDKSDQLNRSRQTRANQIQQLMGQINETEDPKSIQDLTARIQAEQVMATNEAKEEAAFQAQVDAQRRVLDAQALKRQIKRAR